MPPLTRRHFLGSAGAVAALQLLPGCAARRAAAGGGTAEALLSAMAEQLLAEYPENATALGLDKDARAGLKSKLTDRSLHGRARLRRRRGRPAPAASGGRPLAGSTRPSRSTSESPRPLTGWRSRASASLMATSSLSTSNGPTATRLMSWPRIPAPSSRFPTSSTATTSSRLPADAEAYLARLEAYAGALDGETERLAPRPRHRRGRARFPARQDPEADEGRPGAAARANGGW